MKKLMVSAMIALTMLTLSAPVALAKDNDGGQKGNGSGNNSASADRNDGHIGNGNDRNDFDGVNLISVDHDNDFDRDDFDGIDLDDSSDLDIDYDLDGSDWQVVVVDLNGNGVIDEFEYQIALSSL
jgi:hypothetical protein